MFDFCIPKKTYSSQASLPKIIFILFKKQLSHEIDFKNIDKNLQNLA